MGLFSKKEKIVKEKPVFPSVEFYLGKTAKANFDIRDLPLKNQVVIQHSIQFFDDPTPCYIHRGAVQVRLVTELEEALLPLPHGVLLLRESLPQKFLDWVEQEYDSILIRV